MRYLQQIGWGRKLQAEKIKARQKELNENIIALEEQKTAKKYCWDPTKSKTISL